MNFSNWKSSIFNYQYIIKTKSDINESFKKIRHKKKYAIKLIIIINIIYYKLKKIKILKLYNYKSIFNFIVNIYQIYHTQENLF